MYTELIGRYKKQLYPVEKKKQTFRGKNYGFIQYQALKQRKVR